MTTPLETILVCLDYSSKDQELIENASKISQIAGTTEVVFLNVIKEFQLPDQVKKEFPHLIDKAMEERKKELSGLVAESFESKVNKELVVRQGSITREILSVASKTKADLIIMGRNYDKNSVLSARIARRSPCNLLLIPQECLLKFDKVLIPVDFSDYSELSLARALQLTEGTDATIHLQNVISVPSSYRYSGKSYQEFSQILQGHVEKDLNILIKKVTKQKQLLKPIYNISNGEKITELIMQESKRKKVDLIVMGAKGRTSASALFIGSKAERMIRVNHEIPMMIIRKKGVVAGIIETIKETFD